MNLDKGAVVVVIQKNLEGWWKIRYVPTSCSSLALQLELCKAHGMYSPEASLGKGREPELISLHPYKLKLVDFQDFSQP